MAWIGIGCGAILLYVFLMLIATPYVRRKNQQWFPLMKNQIGERINIWDYRINIVFAAYLRGPFRLIEDTVEDLDKDALGCISGFLGVLGVIGFILAILLSALPSVELDTAAPILISIPLTLIVIVWVVAFLFTLGEKITNKEI